MCLTHRSAQGAQPSPYSISALAGSIYPRTPSAGGSGQHFVHHAGRNNARQFLIEALVLERETLVIEAKLIEHRGVKIAHVDRILDDVVREVVGLTKDRAALEAAAGHPHRKAARV